MWGLVDCDNCFCSCERVFRPDLNGRPVVVLSNNDGCVIARSQEAKALGIRMGLPYYQMLEQFGGQGITAFSSNYTLYADMSARIMRILRETAPDIIQYSIDEAFLDLRGMDRFDLKTWGEDLAAKVRQWTGMPVSIGIAPTKTLAKVASKFAKRYPAYRKCCLIATDAQREKALSLFPIEDVWGVGRRMHAILQYYGIRTALEFTRRQSQWVRSQFHVTGERTWAELRGESVIEVDDLSESRKSIMTSRSFAIMQQTLDELGVHIANFAAQTAAKLRRQKSVAGMVTAFVDTNRFRTDLPQYGNSAYRRLLTPSNTDVDIVQAARDCLERIYLPGYGYKRAGVMVSDLTDSGACQPDLFDFDPERHRKLARLSTAVDEINRRHGAETVTLAARQYSQTSSDGQRVKFRDAIKRELKSPNYSTNVDDFTVNCQ